MFLLILLQKAVKYFLRIEKNSDLDSATSDGGDIGVTILHKTGREGPLWIEEGYNEWLNLGNYQKRAE